ncbi:MAG: citrate lyase holo-[acyl-carrier protein] synthase, partial [Spirochaetota bacterium]
DAILACREERARRRADLQQEYGLPAVVFTLNIPGADKASPLYEQAHLTGEREFLRQCSEVGVEVLQRKVWSGACGREALFLMGAEQRGPCASAAELIKRLCVGIETQHTLGRIFDFDVYSADGSVLDRKTLELPQRSCFLCDAPARECARMQRHSVEELRGFIDETVIRFLSQE